MKTVQYFTEEYLETCKKFSTPQRLRFIEDFKKLALKSKRPRTKLISIKIETDLLELFKKKVQLRNQRYQTKIKELMRNYVLGESQ